MSALGSLSLARLQPKFITRTSLPSRLHSRPMRWPQLRPQVRTRAHAEKSSTSSKAASSKPGGEEDEAFEVEEESWLVEKVEDAKDLARAVIGQVPGPRIGSSGAPWLLVLPAAYLGLTFVVAVVKTVQKLNSPKAKRKRQVNKNAGLVESLAEMLEPVSDGKPAREFTASDFNAQARKFGFAAPEVVRKYVRYALNEREFGPGAVASLIRLRKVSGLSDEEIAEILNDVSRRTVKAKGPVVMDTTGFTEKGLQRKVAVQGLFSKLLYLSELEEFCSQAVRDKLQIKPTFGVTDEDADSIRIVSLSSTEDMERLDQALGPDKAGEGSDSSQEDE